MEEAKFGSPKLGAIDLVRSVDQFLLGPGMVEQDLYAKPACIINFNVILEKIELFDMAILAMFSKLGKLSKFSNFTKFVDEHILRTRNKAVLFVKQAVILRFKFFSISFDTHTYCDMQRRGSGCFTAPSSPPSLENREEIMGGDLPSEFP